jgi:hypothetical protein
MVVKVGPEAKVYHVHEALLMRNSGFFCAALSNPLFGSAPDKVVDLIDVDPGKSLCPCSQRVTDCMYSYRIT